MNLPSDDVPALAVDAAELALVDDNYRQVRPIPGSRMFEVREALSVYRRGDPEAEVFDASQGDGGASLPGVPGELLERAFHLQREHGTGYDKPCGTPRFRQAVVDAYWQLDPALGWGVDNCIACQGGRDALLKAYEAMCALGHGRRGDFIVTTRVPWISYTWGPYSIGTNVMLAPGTEQSAWQLTAEGVEACVEHAARSGGRRVAGLVITSPDNPTGRSMPVADQAALATRAFEQGVPFVLFDWIYHRVTDESPYDVNALLRAVAPEHRDRCIVLDGLTKSLGASNVRSAHLLAGKDVVLRIQKNASHGVIPSFYAQAVAIAAYEGGFEAAAATIVEPTNASRAVLLEALRERELEAITGKGYYAFINLAPWIDRAKMADSGEIGTYLAEKHGLAVVPGIHFSQFARTWIRFSYALPPDKTRRAVERLGRALDAIDRG
ncbi:MAG: pyridoxal phosphate-dependent aminotransferase [Deltaproteobacteria bacterium]|jgi:aspartate/methionine/tyrosine aminotransferase|nr:pyridoxal phosphate-dependent aminotransferase [Deltaproteobacteria bacterium]MBW2534467.1 pyridoxal phosphate-dependent aminotransferase [Deltaproteobacteria bacterium]